MLELEKEINNEMRAPRGFVLKKPRRRVSLEAVARLAALARPPRHRRPPRAEAPRAASLLSGGEDARRHKRACGRATRAARSAAPTTPTSASRVAG